MIDEVIKLINDGLVGLSENENVLGIARNVYRINQSENIEFMPGIVNQDGEAIYAGIDDINSIQIYHKINSGNLSINPRSGYGDGRFNEDSILCSVIVAWDTRKINMQSADMLLLIRARMPQEIRGVSGLQNVRIVPSSAILDTKQIFESEYTFDKNYLLPLYINFIKLNYTVAIKYDQQCIDQCINCKN